MVLYKTNTHTNTQNTVILQIEKKKILYNNIQNLAILRNKHDVKCERHTKNYKIVLREEKGEKKLFFLS